MNLTWDEEVILVGNSGFIEDELGQQIPQISERTVSCCRLPVSGVEFYKAGQNGIEISEMLMVHPYEYGGENIVIFQGRKLRVLRVYRKNLEECELSCTEKVGDRDAERGDSARKTCV